MIVRLLLIWRHHSITICRPHFRLLRRLHPLLSPPSVLPPQHRRYKPPRIAPPPPSPSPPECPAAPAPGLKTAPYSSAPPSPPLPASPPRQFAPHHPRLPARGR